MRSGRWWAGPAVLLAACGSAGGDEDATARSVDVLVAVVRHVTDAEVPAEGDDERPFVYVEGRDATIDLETQAGVVGELDGEVDVRFVDERTEAVDESEPGEPVREGAVLLRVAPVPEDGDPVEVELERYRSLDDVEDLRIWLRRRDGTWSVASTSRA